MSTRLKEATEYLRHTYTSDERLRMGEELAGAHNRMADIEAEEQVLKAQVKDKKAQVEQTISKLSRELSTGFTMVNIKCKLIYGDPNPLEVSYYRIDTGEKVKTRAMLPEEMQEELPLEQPVAPESPLTNREGEVAVIPPAIAETIAADSAKNVAEFFGKQDQTAADQPEPIEQPDEAEAPAEQAEPAQPADGTAADADADLKSRALAIVKRMGRPSMAAFQRELRLSYSQAVKLFDELKEAGELAPEAESAVPDDKAIAESDPNRPCKTGKELAEYNARETEKEEKAAKQPRRPRGFDKPANETAW